MESMVWNEEIEMKALLSLFALSLIGTGHDKGGETK